MWLHVANNYTRVARATDEERAWLSDYLSFEDAKARFRRMGNDARVRMLNVMNLTFPTGLLPLVRRGAPKAGYTIEIVDKRERPCEPVSTSPADEARQRLLGEIKWLRDYQLEAVDRAVKNGRGILHLPTGAGKTEVAVALTRALPCNWLFLVHRSTLMEQAAERFEKRLMFEAGRIGDGMWHPSFSTEQTGMPFFTVATFQTLAAALQRGDDKARELIEHVDAVTIDECFPAGTMVGGCPIESLRIGDLVPSFHPESGARAMKRIARLWVRKPSAMVRATFSDGRVVSCTPNHRFWTPHGWMSAKELTRGTNVVCLSNEETVSMRTLRHRGEGRRGEGRRGEGRRGEGRSGARRADALWQAQGSRSGEGREASGTRVDRVEVLEPGRDGTYGGVCPDGLVYNLEVEDTHTYFVEGVGVSNCHVLPASSFWAVAMSLKHAYYRIGLSGTPLARGDQRSLLAIAALGPVIHRIRPDVLIAAGVLARPRIRLAPVRQQSDRPTWQGVYGESIVRSKARNKAIVDAAKHAEKPSLIFVKEIKHGKILLKALQSSGVNCEFVWGSDSTSNRKDAVQRLERGDIDVLICSVIFQEGVDIPALKSVIIGSGGKSVIAAIQRIGRGMRVAAGKTEFEVWDVADRGCGCGPRGHAGCRWLERHTRARLKAYADEGYETVLESGFKP